ncbi:hypothetical protein LKL35_08905 [Streptomyces sp. ET3-23]|uniref:hypothetical protein n=1 Tax=Streptomyces sp. ET3-23 TaxID=2885643 RepID=UPI001D0F8BED|nr:hypothetical protein [Streptomyces sp. ET3-23]MCC2275540.1 hypothetical protein [Streptomyces sp. ET3-23]
MPRLISTEIAGRIEDLYGAPLAVLEAHAQGQPPGMLAALLAGHHDLAFAEQSITFHRERLAQLVHPERQIGVHEVSHVLECARRLAEAVAIRDVQAKTVSAVLHSLGRVEGPEPSPAPAPAAAAAVPTPPVRATSAAPTR